jgi:hypothetical protein
VTGVAAPEALVAGRWSSSSSPLSEPSALAIVCSLASQLDLDALIREHPSAIKAMDGVFARGAIAKSLHSKQLSKNKTYNKTIILMHLQVLYLAILRKFLADIFLVDVSDAPHVDLVRHLKSKYLL